MRALIERIDMPLLNARGPALAHRQLVGAHDRRAVRADRRFRLVGRAGGAQRIALGNGAAGRAARCVLDAALLARAHHRHQLCEDVEAARETGVGVALHPHLARVADAQAEQGWGTKVIDRLAKDLRAAFPDMKGFSPRNLK